MVTQKNILPDPSISLFVKNIWAYENTTPGIKINLPFFADGYPGLMLQQTQNGLLAIPHAKLMPVLSLYGQTIKPIQLEMTGECQLIVFQLYPFVLKSFFNIIPQSINDDCCDLPPMKELDITAFTQQLLSYPSIDQKIGHLNTFLNNMFQVKKQHLDFQIRQAIECIISTKGQQSISEIAGILKLNPRTLERRFLSETGLSPKQFAKIIQFNSSFEQLAVKDYSKLTDIVYENGFADQSHFIKVFKAYTGSTPKAFSQK